MESAEATVGLFQSKSKPKISKNHCWTSLKSRFNVAASESDAQQICCLITMSGCIARMKISLPIRGFVSSAMLVLLGSVGQVVASQGGLKLAFAPLWRKKCWCSSLALELIGLIGVLVSLLCWIATNDKARRRDGTARTASTNLHTMKRFWPVTLIAVGLFLLLDGFIYNAMFLSIPDGNPTLELAARYARYARIATVICWFGVAAFLFGSVAGIIRLFRK